MKLQVKLLSNVENHRKSPTEMQCVSVSVCINVSLSKCLSVYLSIRLSVCFSVCLSISLCALWQMRLKYVTNLHNNRNPAVKPLSPQTAQTPGNNPFKVPTRASFMPHNDPPTLPSLPHTLQIIHQELSTTPLRLSTQRRRTKYKRPPRPPTLAKIKHHYEKLPSVSAHL